MQKIQISVFQAVEKLLEPNTFTKHNGKVVLNDNKLKFCSTPI